MENVVQIPEGSVEIQTGLWLYEYEQTLAGNTYLRRKLYSAEGYCFYDVEEEIYDEEGNELTDEEILPEQRTYSQYASLAISMSSWTITQINARYISVPIEDGFTILSTGNDHVTA